MLLKSPVLSLRVPTLLLAAVAGVSDGHTVKGDRKQI